MMDHLSGLLEALLLAVIGGMGDRIGDEFEFRWGLRENLVEVLGPEVGVMGDLDFCHKLKVLH
jgi:hypothetical protein